jgi:nuclear GTP-binding protein
MPKSHKQLKLLGAGHSRKTERKIPKKMLGPGGLRSNSTINRLKMYDGKFKRNDKGDIVRGSVLPVAERNKKGTVARVTPDRRWFGNTRVIGQKELTKFRDELKKKVNDPYSVLMKQAKIPFSLLQEPEEEKDKIMNKINFTETFGPKSQRKKPKLIQSDFEELIKNATDKETDFTTKKETFKTKDKSVRDPIFEKGQSKRIWGELYKVIDSSDVVIQVKIKLN